MLGRNRCVRISGSPSPLTRMITVTDCATGQDIRGVYRVVLDIDVQRRYTSAVLFRQEEEIQEHVDVCALDVTAHAESIDCSSAVGRE